MTCPACDKAKTEPTGLYYSNCAGCDQRALRQAPSYFDHMQNLKRTPGLEDRRHYLREVARNESREYSDLLKLDFADWFDSERKKRAETC